MKFNKNKFKKGFLYIVDVFFADAKNSFERVITFISALFWTWLEFSFTLFFFTYAIGMATYITGGTYQLSLENLRENKELIKTLSLVIPLFIFFTRVAVYKKKEIKKR